MAEVTKVKVSVGYTKNMGNYESLRVEVGAEADIISGEDVASEVVIQLRENVRKQLKIAVDEEMKAFRQ